MRRPRWTAMVGCLAALCGLAQAQLTESPKLEVVAHLPLAGPNASLWAHKNVVYVGSWTGTTGVKLVDFADPSRPTLITSLPRRSNTWYVNPKVISAETAAFKGDLLAVGLQTGASGVEFWDVTDPRQPRFLSLLKTPGVHELVLFQRQGRILALLSTWGSGLHVVDATDPTRPALLSTWRLQKELGNIPGLGATTSLFDYGVTASADGRLAYVAYRDGGAVILDIADPARPRFLGRTLYPITEEGETHSAVEADGGRLLITGDDDEDPRPRITAMRVTAPARLAGLHPVRELTITRPLVEAGPVRAEVVYVGSALPGTDLLAGPKGKIALADPGSAAQWREQALRVQAAGAVGLLFSQRISGGARDPQITLPGLSLTAETGEALKGAMSAGEKVEAELFAPPGSWGFVRLWDIRDPAKPIQVGTFATAAAREPRPVASGVFGVFSVHNVSVRENRLYLSWWADGVRVVDIANPSEPKEIGHFLPPGQQAPAVWGAVEHNGLILISDWPSGLWILRDPPRQN